MSSHVRREGTSKRLVSVFVFLLVGDPPREVVLAGVVEKAGNVLSEVTVEVPLDHLQGAQEFRFGI